MKVPAKKGAGLTLGALKTKHARRDLPMPASLKTVLLRQRARQAAELEAAREAWEPTGLVFTTATGAGYHPDNLDRALKAVLAWSDPEQWPAHKRSVKREHAPALEGIVAAGKALPAVRVHDLRHTYATHALRLGTPVAAVSRLLGHSRIGLTLDIYRSVLPDELEAAALDLFAPPSPAALQTAAATA